MTNEWTRVVTGTAERVNVGSKSKFGPVSGRRRGKDWPLAHVGPAYRTTTLQRSYLTPHQNNLHTTKRKTTLIISGLFCSLSGICTTITSLPASSEFSHGIIYLDPTKATSPQVKTGFVLRKKIHVFTVQLVSLLDNCVRVVQHEDLVATNGADVRLQLP